MNLLVIEKITKWSGYASHEQARLVQNGLSDRQFKMLKAHNEHTETMSKLRAALAEHDVIVTHRKVGFLTETDKTFDKFHAVITVGGDGTVLYAAHNTDAPILAINSSPSSSIGFYCADQPVDVLITELVNGDLNHYILTRMSLYLDDYLVCDRVMNDVLYCDLCPAVATRYQIRGELQVSSGLWISTAAGSTAGIRSAGGHTMQLYSRNLQFLVREPYQPDNQKYKYTHGFIKDGMILEITNHNQNGRVYVDGTQHTAMVDEGVKLKLSASDKPLYLLQPIE